MKKIALFSLMCCLTGVYAVPSFAGSCGTKILNLDGIQEPGDDEFLYTNKQAQTQAKSDYNNKQKKNDMKNGQYNLNPGSFVLECDNEQCGNFTTVYVPDGGIAENKTGKYFKCDLSSLDDRWVTFGERRDGQEVRE